MASSSTLIIASIQSALTRIRYNISKGDKYNSRLKIGLRSLQGVLLCLRKLDDDDHFRSLFSRIEGVTARLIRGEELNTNIMFEAYYVGKAADYELSWRMNKSSNPLTLTLDEVVGIAAFVLENTHSFLTDSWTSYFKSSKDAFDAVDAFRVQIAFMKNFLIFALQVGVEVEHEQLQNIFLPIVVSAVRVFIKTTPYEIEWYKEIKSKCLAVNHMAADPSLSKVYAQVLSSSSLSQFASMDDDILRNFLDSLISLLWDALRHHSDSSIKDELKVLYERLRSCRAILKQWPTNFDAKFRTDTGVLMRDAGVFIFLVHQQTDHGWLSDLLLRFDVFQAQVITETKPSPNANDEFGFGNSTNINIFYDGNEKNHRVEKAIAPMPSHHQPQKIISPQVVGFQDDEVTSIVDCLTRGSKQLRTVPICGMAGIGKTTFALKLYNHPSIMHNFQARTWCPISQVLDKKKVLLQLLNHIQPGNSLEMTEEDLADKLRKSLKGKRYLILLDDVWTLEVWNNLKASFPNDFTHSRIILTSRNLDIASQALPDEQPHILRLREDNECLDILHTKLFHKEGWTPDLGMKIAKMCKGLPLTVVIVAGLLATTEQESWNGLLDHLRSDGVPEAESAVELSYQYLPDYLKPCFLYLGAYPEDEEVSVKELIWLWMAEGFVRERELKRMEDVAREYMEKLIERSLVMAVQTRSIGGVKTCRIHDLIRDFCLIKAKQENVFHLLLQRNDQLSDFNEPCHLQRLFIHSLPFQFRESGLFCPRALSILFFYTVESGVDSLDWFDISFIIQIYRLLEVLDIHHILLTTGIPAEIELLTQLRYLSITPCGTVIPSSLGNLSNLETFIAEFQTSEIFSLPHSLWNLQKLKYLYVESWGDGFTLPIENLEYSPELLQLNTICGVVLYSDDGSLEKLMRKFPNIRRMKCTILEKSEKEFLDIVVPACLSQLESVSIRGSMYHLKCDYGSTENLRKITLERFELSREEISVIGKFPNLEVLKLCKIQFQDDTLEMEEEGFPQLRILKLVECYGLKMWTACDDQLPCLQKLIFVYCTDLIEIPPFLGTSPTLNEVQVSGCSSALESLVRDIEEAHGDFGNFVKVHIVSQET